MVFALQPTAIIAMLDFSLPKWLLGKEENDPTMWRILSDMESGRTKRPQRKTEERVIELMTEKEPVPGLMEQLRQIPDGSPWKVFITSFNLGAVASGGTPYLVLGTESLRLEQLAVAAREALRQGNFPAAYEQIERWEMTPLPSLQWVMDQIDCHGTTERFAATAAPLVIMTTLYLLACWEVDSFDKNGHRLTGMLLPEMRKGELIRPMTRWLEGVKEKNGIPTMRALSDHLLAPSSKDKSPDNLRREVRKWYGGGEIPAWSRVPLIVGSLAGVFGHDNKDAIEFKVWAGLCMVRILDGLLAFSIKIRDLHLPDYDPLAPFRDYPLMFAHARQVKAALPSQPDQ